MRDLRPNDGNPLTLLWSEETFTHLSTAAQWLYLRVAMSPHLDERGAHPFDPEDLAASAAHTTVQDVMAALVELLERGFLSYDQDLEQVTLGPARWHRPNMPGGGRDGA